METIAQYRHARSAAQKVRPVANQIRGMAVLRAIDVLNYSTTKAADLVKKVLLSAVSNSEHNNGVDADNLVVSKIFVDESFRIKRMHARAKGRGSRIVKRACHITVAVSSIEG